MTRYLTLKVALAVIGVALFGYGMASDNATVRWMGIGFLAASVLTRFLPKGVRGDNSRPGPPDR